MAHSYRHATVLLVVATAFAAVACGGATTSATGGAGGGGASGAGGAASGGTSGSSSGGTSGSSTGGIAGAGGAGATCGDPPCGGDLVGTWSLQKICEIGTGRFQIPNCSSDGTVTVTKSAVSGTVQFDALGNEKGSFTGTFSTQMVIPQGCVTAAECSQEETLLKAQQGVTSASCSFQNTCTCDYTVATTATGGSGTYQTSGTSVTFTDSNGSQTVGSYCVKNNTLTVTQATNASGSGFSMVLARQ